MCTHFETMRISLNFNFSRKRKCESVQSLSCVQLFVTPWTVAHQAPLSVGFSRHEYYSGLPCPSPGDLPNPGIEPRSPTLQVDSLPTEPPGNPTNNGMDSYPFSRGSS